MVVLPTVDPVELISDAAVVVIGFNLVSVMGVSCVTGLIVLARLAVEFVVVLLVVVTSSSVVFSKESSYSTDCETSVTAVFDSIFIVSPVTTNTLSSIPVSVAEASVESSHSLILFPLAIICSVGKAVFEET